MLGGIEAGRLRWAAGRAGRSWRRGRRRAAALLPLTKSKAKYAIRPASSSPLMNAGRRRSGVAIARPPRTRAPPRSRREAAVELVVAPVGGGEARKRTAPPAAVAPPARASAARRAAASDRWASSAASAASRRALAAAEAHPHLGMAARLEQRDVRRSRFPAAGWMLVDALGRDAAHAVRRRRVLEARADEGAEFHPRRELAKTLVRLGVHREQPRVRRADDEDVRERRAPLCVGAPRIGVPVLPTAVRRAVRRQPRLGVEICGACGARSRNSC